MFWRSKSDSRLKEVEEKLDSLERKYSLMRLEWSDTQETLVKRLQKLGRLNQIALESAQDAPREGVPELSDNDRLILSRLPPAQRSIQEKILLNRRRTNGGQ
jgi:hypothetical protein